MKLLYVIHQYFPDCHSGTEQYCLAISREARRRGDQVVVLSLHYDHARSEPPLEIFEAPYDGFRILRLNHWEGLNRNDALRDYLNPVVAAAFRSVLEDVQPDTVHFFHLRQLGVDLLETASQRGLRTIVHLMDFWYLCPRFTLLRSDGTLCKGPPEGGLGCVPCAYPSLNDHLQGVGGKPERGERGERGELGERGALRALAAAAPIGCTDRAADRLAAVVQRKDRMLSALGTADVVVAPSRFLADMFRKNGFVHPNLVVLPYGLEPGRVTRIDVVRPRQPLRVGFIGVLSPWKAAHVLVDAVRQVDGALEVAIHGRLEESMFASYIDDLRRRAEGDPRIQFKGSFGSSEVAAVMADIDVLVVPSLWYENTPFVVLEAQEAGVPVLASDLGGLSESVAPGVNGYLFRAGDVTDLAGWLQRFLREPELLAKLEPKPVARIDGNYDRLRGFYGGVEA